MMQSRDTPDIGGVNHLNPRVFVVYFYDFLCACIQVDRSIDILPRHTEHYIMQYNPFVRQGLSPNKPI